MRLNHWLSFLRKNSRNRFRRFGARRRQQAIRPRSSVVELLEDRTLLAAPVIAVGDLTYTEGDNSGNSVVVDSGATASDAEGNWDGGALTIQITANNEATDEISIGDVGNITVNVTNGEISSLGTHFATATDIDATVTDGTLLTINFDAAPSNATDARIQELLRAVGYRTTTDTPSELARTLTLTLSDDTDSTVDTSTISVTDAAEEVNLSLDVAAGTEAAGTVVTVTATAGGNVTGDQTMTIGASGTGITAADFLLSNTTITILDGATQGQVTFTIENDQRLEGDETATLTISGPSSGITIGATNTRNVTIEDDEIGALSFSSPTGGVNPEQDTTIAVQVNLAISSTGTGTIGLDQIVMIDIDDATTGTAVNGTAANDDFSYATTTLTFSAGDGSSFNDTVNVAFFDDIVDEGDEIAVLDFGTLVDGTSGRVNPSGNLTHTITITDNDTADGAVVFAPTVAGNVRIVLSGANLEVYEGAALRSLAPIADIGNVVIEGTAGDDTRTVDYTGAGNPIPAGGITFNGGGQVGPAGDSLIITNSVGTRFVSQTFDFADTALVPMNGTDGTIQIVDSGMVSRTITFTGLEPIDGGDAMTTTLNLPNSAGGANATLQNHATAGRIEIVDDDLVEFENTNIPNPTVALIVNLGNNGDTLNVEGLDADFDANLTINSGTGSDTVNFQTNTTDIGTGSLTVTATTVNVNFGITTDGGAVDIDADDDVLFAATGSITATDAGNVNITSDADASGGGTGGAFTMAAGSSINAGSGTIGLSADESIVLAAITTTNAGTSALTVTSTSGGISDIGPITVPGTTSLSANVAQNIALNTAANNFGTVSVSSANDVNLIDVNTIDLGASTISGNLSVMATEDITDSGTVQVLGTSSFTTMAPNADIDLGTLAATGAVTLATATPTGDVNIVNATALNLAASTVFGSLTVTATTGNITDSGIVTVTAGNASFTTAQVNSTIALDTLDVTGVGSSIAASTNGVIADATLVNSSAVDLATSTVGRNLDVTATTGDITDSGPVTVQGMAQFTTSAADASVDLGTLAVTGMIGVSTNGATANATLVNATAIDFKATTVGGDLTATATAGGITDAAPLAITGNSSFTVAGGNSITLDDTSNNFVGTVGFASSGDGKILNVKIVDGSALDLGALTLDGSLGVTAAGPITDSGTLAIAGPAMFVTLDNAGADILLDQLPRR